MEQLTSQRSNRLDWNSARLKERVSGGEDAEEIALINRVTVAESDTCEQQKRHIISRLWMVHAPQIHAAQLKQSVLEIRPHHKPLMMHQKSVL